ncbi:MAG: DNA-binding transcriptional regulator [Planktomarina sp.]|nr:DNA-binding transcriptional regulator [Planktomarina sp.]MDT2073607.1 DNA-binding transcriptional regulator [Planktomarina sp.]MDT2078760.1 DNA-binding transcriptional regulator [Planktomarina sp.]|tara:strand:- start:769 stop:1542 length:774 start_codon:yes stop_codon:yes gene_type:complete
MSSSPDNVRALSRGLNILRFLNRAGAARVAEIAFALGLPRPTVYRLLNTLEDEGYVLYSGTDSRVRLSPLAAALGDSSSTRSRLCQIAAPILTKFTDAHAWPVDLSTYEDAHMVIQESTHSRSPLSVDPGMVGYSLPMLRSSSGRAYLSVCQDREREIIIDLLRAENIAEDLPFLQKSWLDQNLTTYFKQGFATRGPRSFRPKTSSLAVPIIVDERVIGCLSIIWVTKAMKLERAIERYAVALQKIAIEISAEVILK